MAKTSILTVVLGKSRCRKCDVLLINTNSRYERHAISGTCVDCHRARAKKWWADNKDRKLIYSAKQNGYKITVDEYKKKLTAQLNLCAICKNPSPNRRLAVDHDHKTDKQRDLLCSNCNTILGLCKENEELLYSIIEYLRRHQKKEEAS